MLFELIDSFKNELSTNSVLSGFASGAVIMSLLTALFYYLKSFPKIFFQFIFHQLTVKMVITNDDYIFNVVNEWFSRHEYSKKARRIRVTSYTFDNTLWTIAPGFGWHLIFIKKRPVLINRVIHEESTNDIKRKETYTILTIGRNQKTIRNLLSESAVIVRKENLIDIYTWWDYWMLSCNEEMRSPSTLVLKDKQFERINNDIISFKNSKDWYLSKGVPYRRGYLLYGPHGTGKTSLVSVLAGIHKADIFILSINGMKDDNEVLRAFQNVPSGSFILIEDVDAAKNFRKRNDENESVKTSGVTLSGLLNAIDGVGSKDNIILFMTTNFREKIDSALIRPGRIDVKEEISLFGKEEVRKMVKLFYNDETSDQIEKAVSLIKVPISPAVLINIFTVNKDNISSAIREMIKLLQKSS